MQYKIDIARIFHQLVRKSWLVAVSTLVAGLVGFMLTADAGETVYSAYTTIYSISVGSYKQSIEGYNAMLDYSGIIGSNKVATRATTTLSNKYNLSTNEIISMISTSFSDNSAIMMIIARSTDPQLSIDVANAVSDAFTIEINNITGENDVQILDHAQSTMIYSDAVSNQLRQRIIFAAVGFIASIGYIVLYEIFNTKIKCLDETSLFDINIIGVLPNHDI